MEFKTELAKIEGLSKGLFNTLEGQGIILEVLKGKYTIEEAIANYQKLLSLKNNESLSTYLESEYCIDDKMLQYENVEILKTGEDYELVFLEIIKTGKPINPRICHEYEGTDENGNPSYYLTEDNDGYDFSDSEIEENINSVKISIYDATCILSNKEFINYI